MMRHTALYETENGRDKAIKAIQTCLGQFENLFRNINELSLCSIGNELSSYCVYIKLYPKDKSFRFTF